MNLVRKTKQRYLISLTSDELRGISNALNEVSNGLQINEPEFQTRLGHTRSELINVLDQIGKFFVADQVEKMEVAETWSDAGSVQVRAISVFGDPVDMGADEALSFATEITRCAHEADGV
ncbi:MAG TPA: hypothetical protein VGN23_06220 [Verrucomicrobiae bacterium]|jgi:hypothetical protein